MKKAKIILTCVAILAVVGGALAFRANRLPSNVFTLLAGSKATSITVGGIVYTTTIPNCTLTALRTVPGTPNVIVSSTTTDPNTVVAFKSAGHPDIITTYAYCTQWFTRTADSND
jgi:hypothetical protein